MKKLILLTALMCGSIYSMDEYLSMGQGHACASNSSSSKLTEYQKKKLALKKLEIALHIREMHPSVFQCICPSCGTFSNRLTNPNKRPTDSDGYLKNRPGDAYFTCIGSCGDKKSFHQYAYVDELRANANIAISRVLPLLNESE